MTDKVFLELFQKGGPIMWPLLGASLIGMTVVIERIFFIVREKMNQAPDLRKKILFSVEAGNLELAQTYAQNSNDSIVKMLSAGLEHRHTLQTALVSAAAEELKKYVRGSSVLDTIITLAPLLGLLGTVTGMIGAFGMLGGQELDAPTAITGGIAEALIATAFGLSIAIFCLIPFNWLNAYSERIKHEMEQTGSLLESLVAKAEKLEKEAEYAAAANLR